MTAESRITVAFRDLAQSKRMAFMPFLTAGDRREVDLIEVGFPYSDPIADGPVIQASYTRALSAGLRVEQIFERFEDLDPDRTPPLVAMVSFSIVSKRGSEQFVQRAARSGFSGMIVPDLPGDEAGELVQVAGEAGLDLVPLIAPTTPASRAGTIIEAARGFLYCISVAGTTGARAALPSELDTQLAELREQTELPLAVGFGISEPDHISALKGKAEGAIVGSALVKQLETLGDGSTNRERALAEMGDWVASLVAMAHG